MSGLNGEYLNILPLILTLQFNYYGSNPLLLESGGKLILSMGRIIN